MFCPGSTCRRNHRMSAPSGVARIRLVKKARKYWAVLTPGYSFCILSKWEGQICPWPQPMKWRWKILLYESEKSFPDFLTNVVRSRLLVWLVWVCLVSKAGQQKPQFHQADEIKSKEEHVNTVTGVLTCISPQSSASSSLSFIFGCEE